MATRASAPLTVDPQGASVSVNITFDPSGTAAPMTAKNGSTPVSLPDLISSSKTYWLPPARYIVTVSLNGVTIHNQPYDVDGSMSPIVTPVLDYAETAALVGAGSGASGQFIVTDPVTVSFDDAGLDTTGVALCTTEPGDLLVGLWFEVNTAFDTGEKMTVGTADMLADSDYIGPTRDFSVDSVDYVAPGTELSYLPKRFVFGATAGVWVTPSASVVRAKTVTGGNAAGQLEARVIILRVGA